MQQILGIVACAAALLMGPATALAQETVKIGLINVINGDSGTGGTARRSDMLVAGKTGSAEGARIFRTHDVALP